MNPQDFIISKLAADLEITNKDIYDDFDLIDKEIKLSMNCEIDCEMRTVQKIKKYGLDEIINIDEYIQGLWTMSNNDKKRGRDYREVLAPILNLIYENMTTEHKEIIHKTFEEQKTQRN